MNSQFLTISFVSGFALGVIALVWLLTIVLIVRSIVRRRRSRRSFDAGFKRMQERERRR